MVLKQIQYKQTNKQKSNLSHLYYYIVRTCTYRLHPYVARESTAFDSSHEEKVNITLSKRDSIKTIIITLLYE